MGSYGQRVNLKQYRRLGGKWQFVPVVNVDGNPNPKLVLIDGAPESSKGGVFYLEWRENGKRITRELGTSPREALDAWRRQCLAQLGLVQMGLVQTGVMDAEEEEPLWSASGLTIDAAVERYLVDIRATKSTRTYKEYRRQLAWFQAHTTKRLVSELDRSDAMRIFATGREERVKGNPINQKTINKRVIIMLNAMRSQGARIEMRRGGLAEDDREEGRDLPAGRAQPVLSCLPTGRANALPGLPLHRVPGARGGDARLAGHPLEGRQDRCHGQARAGLHSQKL